MPDERAPGRAAADVDLAGLGDLTGGYAHYDKWVTPGEDLSPDGGYLKWYDIHRQRDGMPATLGEEARLFLREEQAGRAG